jgi:3-oxoacyl-[acyl-carrier-protein] synthase III
LSSYIRAISYHLPEKALTNEELCSVYPHLDAGNILRLVGIGKRHIVAPGQVASDLAYESAEGLFTEHGIDRKEIDFLIFCASGLDHRSLATACILHNRLGLANNCGAFDINLGCTGFVYCLGMARALIESGQAKNVLLLTADMPSTVLHPDDHELRILFGDAAAATLVCKGDGASSIGAFLYGTDGSGADHLTVRNSGVREPVTTEWLEKNKDAGGLPFGRMEMKAEEIFLFALRVVPPMVKGLLEKAGLEIQDIDLFVFHQANRFMLEILRKKMKISPERFYICMEHCGNTVSASIPIALYEAMKEGKAKKGDKVLVAGFGIGLSWGGTILTI